MSESHDEYLARERATLGFIEVEDEVFEDPEEGYDDPYTGLPFGEQQREVDWLETRYESEPEPYDQEDGPWDC